MLTARFSAPLASAALALVLMTGAAAIFSSTAHAAGNTACEQIKGDPDPTIADCTRLLKEGLSPESHALALGYRGYALHRKGREQEALADLDEAIRRHAKSSFLFAARAIVLEALLLPDRALADYDVAVRLGTTEPSVFINRGSIRLARRQLLAALADFKQAVAIDGKDASSFRSLALAHLELKQFGQALGALERALALEPRNARILATRGLVHHRAGNAKKAESDLRAALKIEPANVEFAGLLSEVTGKTVTIAAAAPAVHQQPAGKPTTPPSTSAVQAMHTPTTPAPAPAVSDPVDLGPAVALIEQGRIIEAILALDDVVNEAPDSAAARVLRGAAYVKAGRPDDAIRDVTHALRFAPNDPSSHWVLCQAYEQKGLADEAIAGCGRAIALDPGQYDALVMHGALLSARQQLNEAMASLNAAIRIRPQSSPTAYGLRAMIFYKARSLDVALADIEESLRQAPGYGDAYNARGLIRFNLGMREQAIEDFHMAIRFAKSGALRAEALNNRGSAYELMGRQDLAIVDYRMAAAADPASQHGKLAGQAMRRLESAGRKQDGSFDV